MLALISLSPCVAALTSGYQIFWPVIEFIAVDVIRNERAFGRAFAGLPSQWPFAPMAFVPTAANAFKQNCAVFGYKTVLIAKRVFRAIHHPADCDFRLYARRIGAGL